MASAGVGVTRWRCVRSTIHCTTARQAGESHSVAVPFWFRYGASADQNMWYGSPERVVPHRGVASRGLLSFRAASSQSSQVQLAAGTATPSFWKASTL